MKAEEKRESMRPVDAAQLIIDRGGMFLLNKVVENSSGQKEIRTKCRWSIPRDVPKESRTDSARRIIRHNENSHRPYTADEVVGWLGDGNPLHRVGLFPYTAGMVVLDFDSGSEDDQQSWARAFGHPACLLRSTSGRGLHAWFRRPADAEWGDLKKTGFLLCGLRGNDDVRGDFIPCNGQALIRDGDSLVRLAESLDDKGCELSLGSMRALYECGPHGGVVGSAIRAVRDSASGQHHMVIMREAGRLWGGPFRKEPQHGFLFRAFMTVASMWSEQTRADSERGLLYISEKRDEERLARYQAYKEALEARGEKPEVLDEDAPVGRGDAFELGHEGLRGICVSEGWTLGESRRGKKRMLIDSGDGWKDLAGSRLELMLGEIRRHYFRPTADDDKPKPWFVSSSREMNAIMRSLAHGCQVDPFKDYLDSLPDLPWDDGAEARLMRMPFRLWRFSTPAAIVGLAFRYTMCGAVARCYEPGVKHDSVMVLSGPQGLGKSEFIKRVLPDGVKDLFTRFDLKMLGEMDGYKKVVEKINGKVFAEISEMKSTGSNLAETVKDFISAGVDEVRFAYDNEVLRVPRDAVFIATANRPDPLYADPSGNRRFHGVAVVEFADEGMASDLDSIDKAMNDGLRDEWWALAKACWNARGIDSHRPVGDEIRLFSANEGEFEKTSDMSDEVDNLVDGLMLADSMGGDNENLEWVLPFVSHKVVTDALGLTSDERRKVSPIEAGSLKNAMLRRGWRQGKKRVSGDDGSVRQRVVFWPEASTFPSGYPVMNETIMSRWVERAVDTGMPVTAADIEAAHVPAEPGLPDEPISF